MSKNHVFDTLTGGGYDPVGLIAYSLYKSHKRLWAQTVRDKYDREPTAEEERVFASTNTEAQLQLYINQAKEILKVYGDDIIKNSSEDISKNAIAGRIETALQKVEAHHGWRSSVSRGVVVAVLTAVALAVLVSIIDRLGFSLLDFFTGLID